MRSRKRCKRSALKSVYGFLFVMASCHVFGADSAAEQDQAMMELPAQATQRLLEARERQTQLTEHQPQISVRQNYTKRYFRTSFIGLPHAMRQITVYDRRDLKDLLADKLPQYFSLVGQEGFIFLEKMINGDFVIYDFRQTIDGIPVRGMGVRFFVDRDTKQLEDVRATIQLDVGLPQMSPMKPTQAIKMAMGSKSARLGLYRPLNDPAHKAKPIYHARNGVYELAMSVLLAHKASDATGRLMNLDPFIVFEDGTVIPGGAGAYAILCDASGTKKITVAHFPLLLTEMAYVNPATTAPDGETNIELRMNQPIKTSTCGKMFATPPNVATLAKTTKFGGRRNSYESRNSRSVGRRTRRCTT